MPGLAVEIEGLKDFRRDLNRAGDGWGRVVRGTNRKIADYVAGKARGMTETRQQAAAAGAIRGSATTAAAKVAITRNPVFAQGAFFGALQFPQFPAWVGNSWEPGGAGGPYAVNPAIRDALDDIVDAYGDAFEHIAAIAFVDGAVDRKSVITASGSF